MSVRKNRTNVLRFGGAEYESSECGVRPSLVEMRTCFLQLACLEVPKIANDLETILPVFRKIHGRCCIPMRKAGRILSQYTRKSRRPLPWNQIESKLYKHSSKLRSLDVDRITELRNKMFEWSAHHDIDEQWCRESAYETLDLWFHDQKARTKRQWYWNEVTMLDPEVFRGHSTFLFEFTTFYPQKGLRSNVEYEIRKAFETKLQAFLNKSEANAMSHGMERTPMKLNLDHFRWLVLHQVKKPPMTCKQIFISHKKRSKSEDLPLLGTERAIAKAIKVLADELGLKPRYVGRGRKPKHSSPTL